MRLLLLFMLIAPACRPVVATAPPESVSMPPPTASARRWFLRARVAESRGDVEEAERALKWVVREDGRRPVAHEQLAAFFERERRWIEAENAWNRALSLDTSRWQPHAALARLAGRAGDDLGEFTHLMRAVELGGNSATHERLFDLQDRAVDPGARRTLERWLRVPLTDPVERLRRARAARRLGAHAQALDDLIAVAEDGGRVADVAPMIWESAERSCRYRTALSWARGAPLTDPAVVETVRQMARAIGDPALLERVDDPRAQPPAIGLHSPWPAPPLPLTSEVSDKGLYAEAWRRAGQPKRALELLQNEDGAWVSLVRAYALVSTGEPDAAWAEASAISKDHPAWIRAQVLGLGLGHVGAAALQAQMVAGTERALADGAVELFALPGVDRHKVVVHGVPLGQSEMPDALVRVPASVSAHLEAAMLREAIHAARALGQRREAQRLAKVWTERRPDQAKAWVGRALADPEHADGWLDRALELSPCDDEALLLRAHHAPAQDALRWLRAAQDAAPFSPTVYEALAQRGLETR